MTQVLPKGWEEKKLGEVSKIGAGNSAPQDPSCFVNGSYNFFRTSDIGKVHFGKIERSEDLLNKKGCQGLHLFEAGTILIPKSGASTFLNHRVKMDREGYVVSHLATVKANSDIIDEDYLLYFLSTVDSKTLIQSHSYPSLNLPIISSVKVIFPSLTEQKRIVEKLDKIFADINKAKENIQKNLNNAKEVFESYLNKVFTENTENWEEKTIREIASIKGGKRVPKGYKLVTYDTGYPYIRVTDFNNWGTVDLNDIHFVEKSVYEKIKRYTISSEDVYISIAGTIGKSGIIPSTLEGANLTENACKLVLNKSISKYFMYYFTLSKCFLSQIVDKTKVAGQPKLALTRLGEVVMSIPSLAEQERIVKKLDALQEQIKKLEQIYTKKLADLEELKKALLEKAFSGEL